MSRRARQSLLLLGALALAALAFLAWRGVLSLALLGWDSYPLIRAARVGGLAELAGTFGEELMDGAYPLGRFWRPVVHLSFALDHALWGLAPAGYHATGLVLLAACGVTLLFVARRLLGHGAWLAPLVAGLVYVLHPVQVEILPVPARRAEALAVLFTLLALLAQPLAGEPRRRAWLAGLFCALALASKETGAMAIGLLLALALASSRQSRWGSRLAACLRATWPAWLCFGATLAVRTAALSGLGGSKQSSLTANLAAAPSVLRNYLADLVAPSASLPAASPLVADVLLVLLAALLARLSLWRAAAPDAGAETAALPPPRFGLFLALSALVVALITSVSGLARGWYALPFLPLYCLALAFALDLGLGALARGPRLAGACAVLLVAWLVTVPVCAVSRAGALAPLQHASVDEAVFLERFEAAVEGAPDGSTITVPGLPTERRADPRDPDSPNILMLAPYSLEAYAKLRFPERTLRLELAGRTSGAPPGAGELVVVLAP